LALFGPGLRSARRLLVGLERTSIMNPTMRDLGDVFCRIAARIRSREKVPAGHDLDVASSKSRDLDDCPRSLTKEATMNLTGGSGASKFSDCRNLTLVRSKEHHDG
jgi:hypothetical protein